MFGFIKDIIRYIRIMILHLLYRCKSSLPLSDNTVIVAPHPDDEVIGCAGLIQTLVERGIPPHVIILSGGEGSHRGCCDISEGRITAERRHLALEAARVLDIPESHIHFLDFPDDHISKDDSETEKLVGLMNMLAPKTVFIPHSGEVMPDHIHAAEIVRHLMKNEKVSIFEYCVWMWYYNVWNFVGRNAYTLKIPHAMHQRKLQAIEQYTIPLAPCGKPWSGVLPQPFLKAAQWNRELYFKVK